MIKIAEKEIFIYDDCDTVTQEPYSNHWTRNEVLH